MRCFTKGPDKQTQKQSKNLIALPLPSVADQTNSTSNCTQNLHPKEAIHAERAPF